MSVQELDQIRVRTQGTTSLQTAINFQDSSSEVGDLIADTTNKSTESISSELELKKELNLLIEHLPAREKEVLKIRLGLSPYRKAHSLKEAGKRMGCSRERIRQIGAKAIKRLNRIIVNSSRFKGLKSYLEEFKNP